MDGALGTLVSWGVGAAVVAAAARPYLLPKPSVHRPTSPPAWPLFPSSRGAADSDGSSAADGSELLRCCQINVWSGSTYELEPEGANTAYQLFFGRFGSFEPPGQREARRSALLSELRRLQPALVTINEAASEDWVRQLADELGLCAIWHSGVAVVRMGPLSLPPAIEEGDAILFHPALECEHVARQRLSGSVWGERAAFNFGDATQALGALLRTPAGRRLYVVGTHWQASLIEDAGCERAVADLAAAAAAAATEGEGGEPAARILSRQEQVLQEGRRLMKEGTAMRVQESEGVLRLLASDAAQGADGRLVMGDLNTTPGTPEVSMLLERGGLVDAWAEAGGSAGGETWVPANPHVAVQVAAAENLEPGVVHTGGPVLPWETAAEDGSAEAVAAEVKTRTMHEMEGRALRLDYILLASAGGGDQREESASSEGGLAIAVESCRVVMDGGTKEPQGSEGGGDGVVPSDHYGVVADIRLRSRM